jgi:hypothetical protein
MPQMLDAILEQVSGFFCENLQQEIKITRIDAITLRAWSETWKPISKRQPPNGGWDWIYKNKNFERKYQKYLIAIAIWESNKLCGLALCSRSKGNDNI